MTKAELIIELLREHGALYGLELVKLSRGRLSRGVIYITLDALEDDGLIVSREVKKRRVYRLTSKGNARTTTNPIRCCRVAGAY